MIIGAINGWFDGLHPGHFLLFKQAKEQCDYLIAFINHDSLWTKNRQKLFTHNERKMMLENIKHIDEVIIFDTQTPINLILLKKVSKVFKGLDYQDIEFSEKRILIQNSIDIIFLTTTDHHSSQLVDKMSKVV